jgi:zinc protease
LDYYRKVRKEDIQRVAREYLDIKGRVVLNYMPKSAQAPETPEGVNLSGDKY